MSRPPMPIGTYGSITATNAGNKWRAFTRARDLDGAVRQVSASGPTKGAAVTALKQKLKDRFVALDGEVSPDMTLAALGDLWLAKTRENGQVSDSSLDTYAWAVAVLGKRAGKVRVREATVPRVDTLIRTLHGESKSKGRMVRIVLGQMLGLAARQGAIPANPVRSLDRMARGKKDVRALDVAGIAAVRAAVTAWQTRPGPGPRDKDLADIIDAHLATGCRIGEVLAFRWADVDFDAGTVTVNGTMRHIKGKGLVRQPQPKSDASRRTLHLPAFALQMLADRAERCDTDPASPVFPNRNDSWKSPHTVRTQWRAARAGTGLEWVSPHTLRKTVATHVKSRSDTGTASKILGHASEQVTDDHYIDEPDGTPDVTEYLDELGPKPRP